MTAAPPRNGFTLLELLVAITLLGVVMAAAAGAIASVGRGFDRGTARTAQVQDLALVRDILRRQMAKAVPWTEPDGEVVRFVFRGTATELAFVIVEPPAPARGGPALARFRIESSPAGSRLTYSQEPLAGGAARESVLAEGPYRFRFGYLSVRPDTGPAWVEDWDRPQALPTLVRLEMTAEGRDRPAAIVRFRADADRGCVLALGEGFCRDLVQESLP